MARQYIGKHAWSTIEDIRCWAMDVFSWWSVPNGCKRQRRSFGVSRVSSASRQDMILEAEELNREIEASELLSAG
jgi:hypothetical protein